MYIVWHILCISILCTMHIVWHILCISIGGTGLSMWMGTSVTHIPRHLKPTRQWYRWWWFEKCFKVKWNRWWYKIHFKPTRHWYRWWWFKKCLMIQMKTIQDTPQTDTDGDDSRNVQWYRWWWFKIWFKVKWYRICITDEDDTRYTSYTSYTVDGVLQLPNTIEVKIDQKSIRIYDSKQLEWNSFEQFLFQQLGKTAVHFHFTLVVHCKLSATANHLNISCISLLIRPFKYNILQLFVFFFFFSPVQ